MKILIYNFFFFYLSVRTNKLNNGNQSNEPWSGEATRNQGFAAEDTRIDITIDGADSTDTIVKQKDRPIWMTESTVITNDNNTDSTDVILQKAAAQSSNSSSHSSATTTSSATSSSTTTTTSTSSSSGRHKKDNEDIMSVLLQHEKQGGKHTPAINNAVKGLSTKYSSDSSEEDEDTNFNFNCEFVFFFLK